MLKKLLNRFFNKGEKKANPKIENHKSKHKGYGGVSSNSSHKTLSETDIIVTH